MNSGSKRDQTAHKHATSRGTAKARRKLAHEKQVMRRIDGGRMLKEGARPADVALALGVSRTTVYAWKSVLDKGGGLTGLRRLSRGGRPPRLSDGEVVWLQRVVALETPEEHHIDPTTWGLSRKRWTAALICKLVKQKFSVDLSEVQIRRLVGPLRD